MAANTALVVAGLSFDNIRSNLQSFIAAKPGFEDHDFNSSAISTLLDLLAYNTQLNAFYLNMAVNESFLDTAVIRDSVASHAKMLGYLPRSAQGPTANVKISFSTAVANSSLTTLTIAKNTQFSATINGTSYRFVTPQSYLIEANSTNGFQGYINIIEGRPITHRYAYSASNTSFVLPNKKVDTRSITVTVTESGNTQAYIQASDLRTSNSISKIFFIEPDRDSQYKVVFGDGILGRAPVTGATVSISYRVCNGSRTNGANSFSAVSTVAGESNFTITPQGRATGGSEEESIAAIKYNAPRAYATQNRAVVTYDYEQILLRDNADISAVRVWGGQDNDPPIYGKVYVSIKPVTGVYMSSARKNTIKNSLKRYAVVSIDTEIVDPSYLYIVPNITVRYDPTRTSATASEIASLIATRVINYESTKLNNFLGKFRLSEFLNYLDNAEKSVVGSSATIDTQLRFVPSTTAKNNYTFRFNRPLEKYNRYIPDIGSVSSSVFTFAGFPSYIDDNDGTVRIYYKANVGGTLTRTYSSLLAGTVNYTTGTVTLSQFQPQSYTTDAIKIIARPLDTNIEPVRNQILLFSDVKITVINDDTETIAARIDSVATIGQSALYENVKTATSTTTF